MGQARPLSLLPIGILRPIEGECPGGGLDLYQEEVAAKQRLAFVPDVPRFYQELTTWEHLRFISLAFGVEQGWETRAETSCGNLVYGKAVTCIPIISHAGCA